MKTPKNMANGSAKPPGKKPYHRPVIQLLGKLHLQTQGTGGMKGDGAQGMTRL